MILFMGSAVGFIVLAILLVELGVGITVASVMIVIFFKFTWRTVKHKYKQ